MSSLKVHQRIQQVWHFNGTVANPKYKDSSLLHFPPLNSASVQRHLVFRIHESLLVARVFQAQSTSLWPLVRFRKGFFDLHYCSGAISNRLHMSLINLIPSGNSLDTWVWHCCLLTLLFTFSTACARFGYHHAICLWKRSKVGLYELDFDIIVLPQ